jgi:hypothetical protein
VSQLSWEIVFGTSSRPAAPERSGLGFFRVATVRTNSSALGLTGFTWTPRTCCDIWTKLESVSPNNSLYKGDREQGNGADCASSPRSERTAEEEQLELEPDAELDRERQIRRGVCVEVTRVLRAEACIFHQLERGVGREHCAGRAADLPARKHRMK